MWTLFQVARAENGILKVLRDGVMDVNEVIGSRTVFEVASSFSFGLYDALLESFRGKPIKVISSMGKQSTGNDLCNYQWLLDIDVRVFVI